MCQGKAWKELLTTVISLVGLHMFVLFFIFNNFPGIHVLFSSEEKLNKKRLQWVLKASQ